MTRDESLIHFDYVRVVVGVHKGRLAEYQGLDRDQTNYWIHFVVGSGCDSVPFGGLEKINVSDFSSEEATWVAREYIQRLDDPTFRFQNFSNEELLEGEGGGGAVVCAREELDDLRLEPTVVSLLTHHIEVPAVATLLGRMLAKNELLRIEEKRMEEVTELRYERAWGSKPVLCHRNPTEWLVDHGGLCP